MTPPEVFKCYLTHINTIAESTSYSENGIHLHAIICDYFIDSRNWEEKTLFCQTLNFSVKDKNLLLQNLNSCLMPSESIFFLTQPGWDVIRNSSNFMFHKISRCCMWSQQNKKSWFNSRKINHWTFFWLFSLFWSSWFPIVLLAPFNAHSLSSFMPSWTELWLFYWNFFPLF